MFGPHTRKLSLVIFCLLVLSNRPVDGRELTSDPNLSDTVTIKSVTVNPNQTALVRLDVVFDEPLAWIEITLVVADSQFVIDSVSFVGGLFTGGASQWIRLSPQSVSAVISPPSGDLLNPTSGVLGRVFVTPARGLADKTTRIDTTTYFQNFIEHTTYFADALLQSFRPVVQSADVTVLPACCRNVRGNVDDSPDEVVDISDLTQLIGYLYLSTYASLNCFDEADLDLPPDMSVDIADLTRLIDYLYISPGATPLPNCP